MFESFILSYFFSNIFLKSSLLILVAVALAAACPFASKDGKGLLLELAPLEGAGVRCIDLGTRDSWVRAFPLLKFEIKIFLARELTNDFAHLSQKLWRFF